jgi:hypothetical protein
MNVTVDEDADDGADSYRGVPVWEPTYPTDGGSRKFVSWLTQSPHRRAELPNDYTPFTARAIDERHRNETIAGAKKHGVITAVGYLKPYAHAPKKRSRTSKVPIYQLTRSASQWFDDHEPTETLLPCDCETSGFTNVGTIDHAPTDERYYACNHCGVIFPQSEVRE